MKTERIKEIRASKDAARMRQERNFQESGIGSYATKAKGYEEIVEICDRALMAADDHDAARTIRRELYEVAEAAKRAAMTCIGGGTDTPVVLNKIMNLAKRYGWRDDR